MVTKHYSVCGLQIQIDLEKDIQTQDESRLFLVPSAPEDVRIHLTAAPEILIPGGIFCGTSPEHPVYRSGNLVSRCSWDQFRSQPHIRVDYALENPRQIQGFVLQSDWAWATRGKYLWTGVAINSILLHFRAMIFHSSYIGYRNTGILFTAPSGTGKSTQAALWQKHRGAKTLNGDKAGIRLGTIPTVHGVPFSGTSGICENVSLPLKAVVVLRQSPINSIRRLAPSEAMAALFPNLFVDKAVPEEWQTAIHLMLDLVATVPIYELACTPDIRAVETLERAIFP